MINKHNVKILVLIISIIFGIVGCAKSEDMPMPDVKNDNIIELDWYVDLSWWDKAGSDGKDLFSKTIQDELGIKLNIITPATDGAQQLDTMISSKQLPDIISVESWLGYQTRMAKAGVIYDMNTLIEQYAPTFEDKIKQDVFEWYKEADGKTYGFPNYAYSVYDLEDNEILEPNACFVLRSDMYDAIGRPEFHTYDEFLNVLEMVKQKMPKVNGEDIVPLQLYEFLDVGNTSIDTWLPEYFAVPFEDNQGKFLNCRRQPGFYEVLDFVNSAYRNGYMKHENFLESREQINQKVVDGRVFALLVATQDFEDQFKALFKKNPAYKYESFIITNSNGDDPILRDMSGYGWLYTMVSKNCKYPDKAIQLLEFLSSNQGQMLAYFGKEGISYTLVDGKVIWTEDYQQALREDRVTETYGTGFDLMINWLYIKDFIKDSEDPFDVYFYSIKDPLLPYSIDRRAMDLRIDRSDPKAFELYEIENRVNLYWGTVLPQLIMSENDSELYEAYHNTLEVMDELGMALLDDFYIEAYAKEKVFYETIKK